ncbi:RNA polymerase factor sigma-54 [Aestuariivirga litoralis]|uniref:RNA polymerase factor sigma-54 n=1 Tax=Aestuariivirga litoralis TaxID=2650924 RepID=UPI0018C495D4|nr:RNA polymerase factor sigma-54 [Aestuariivirga litoralis]MBG1232948.1 RNA polymerase factor sigma-54 [Aestuariivirga litoralis]
MALMQKLALKQGQSLVMTPQLQQAIKLLQMSNVEIQAFVDQELERNPLLERPDAPQETAAKPEASDDVPDAPFSAGDARGADGDGAVSASDGVTLAQAGPSLDPGWQSIRGQGTMSLDGEASDFAASVSREDTLSEHLTKQLNLHFREPQDLLIGQYIIGGVNEQGYLTLDVAAIAEAMGTDEAQVNRVLGVLKTFDPAGVFASDLKECLALQLRERDHFDPAMEILVENLPLVARRDYPALKALCGVSLDDLHDMIAELRQLNPKPGHAFGSEPVMPVMPDVNVRAAPDGSWIVELNSETLPRVLINNQYAAHVSGGASRAEDKQFLSEAHANASWLVKSLDQRARTILKVAQEIVKQQDAFLVLGIAHLRPITLRMVAEAIEMHESTVSRVTSNKYMATPRGTFELKYFFTNAIASAEASGETHSSESVRHRIKELIAVESAEKILSDDDLVDILKTESIDIARRTVAKYRESLNILSSVQRRREARAKR